MVRRVGVAHAKRLLLTGAAATFGAGEALSMGFANRVVRRDQLTTTLHELTEAWETKRGKMSKEDFVKEWMGERARTSEKTSRRLASLERLWSDPDAVKVMVLGQVPPWLEGEERKLAEKEVRAIRRGSPEAILLLNRMVDEGDSFDLRQGLIAIFDSPNARAAIGAFAGGPRSGPFRWPRVVQPAINQIVAEREERLHKA